MLKFLKKKRNVTFTWWSVIKTVLFLIYVTTGLGFVFYKVIEAL